MVFMVSVRAAHANTDVNPEEKHGKHPSPSMEEMLYPPPGPGNRSIPAIETTGSAGAGGASI